MTVCVSPADAAVSVPQWVVRGVQCRKECVINSRPDVARSRDSSTGDGVALVEKLENDERGPTAFGTGTLDSADSVRCARCVWAPDALPSDNSRCSARAVRDVICPGELRLER